ncbi:MAG TPA: acylphosphatase [Actinomycetota bacterium]|nr:acylphosphatase [Actinomycetota bacterium]
MKRVRVTVSGRVQGVFYRATCARLARNAGVAGHVRNLPDGRVQAVFEGPEDDVDWLIAWCRTGPEMARVDEIEVVAEQPVGDVEFRVSH